MYERSRPVVLQKSWRRRISPIVGVGLLLCQTSKKVLGSSLVIQTLDVLTRQMTLCGWKLKPKWLRRHKEGSQLWQNPNDRANGLFFPAVVLVSSFFFFLLMNRFS